MTDISAIIKVFMEPGLKTDRPGQATLRPGTMLNGRITNILPSGLLQINFGKFRTQTRVRFPVAKGDTLRCEVLETGNRIKLKIQDPPRATNKAPIEQSFKPEDLQHFRRQLETTIQKPGAHGKDGLRPFTARLSQLLLSLQAGRAPDQLAPLIKALLTNSGIFFEKKLETILLQLFKTPESIDVGRAATHPFVTNIFDCDLKPNLLKLAAALEQTRSVRDSKLTPIRTTTRNLINHIEAAQALLIRTTPAKSGKTAAVYTHNNSSNRGSPRHHADTLPAAIIKTLQVQLIKTGLWSDPQIRALLPALAQVPEAADGRNTGPIPALKQMDSPVASQLPLDIKTINKKTLQRSLAGMIKNVPVPGSNTLAPLLSDFRGYMQANRLRLDAHVEKALDRLEIITRTPLRAGSPGNRTSRRIESTRQDLQVLARFIESRPPQDLLKSPPPLPRTLEKNALSKKHALGESREMPLGSRRPAQANGIARPAQITTGREINRVVTLIEPKATALSTELDRIDKALAEIAADKNVSPAGKKLSNTVRALQVLIDRNQMPTGDAVDRALVSLAAPRPSPGITTVAALKPSIVSENLLMDLAALREFISLQKTELSETMETLRGLLGKTDSETDTGDRYGPDRGRGADPLQVITFTLPMEEGQKPARLKVFYPFKKSASTGAGFRISLLLSMERMGPLRADIFTHQNNLEVKFSAENEHVRRYIDGHLNRLGDLLKGPFETVNLTATVDEKNIAAFEYEDLELSGDRLVDLKA